MEIRKLPAVLWSALLLAVVGRPILAEDNARFGQPACPGQVMDKTFYLVCYSGENKTPVWVEYALTSEDMALAVAKRTNDFRADPDLPPGERAKPADYAKTGFDMGHMAPADDFVRSKKAMSTSFLLSNMVPQRPKLNRNRWRGLESAVRQLAKTRGTAWIVTGPVYAGNKPIKTIGADKVAVPSHCFKVVLTMQADGTKEMFAVVMPNTNAVKADLAHFAQTVRFVEKLTGLDFFSALSQSEQDSLEIAGNTLPAK
jgi:endonuclease G